MNKSMYSLMLMDEVVKEVDKYAYLHDTNRSNLINQILAEYLNVATPEMISKEIFGFIGELMNAEVFQIVNPTSPGNLAIKSSLEYKYRPTIKYNIELYRSFTEDIGTLSVTFRTQSPALLKDLAIFFEYWIGIEEHYSDAKMYYPAPGGKFIRGVRLNGEYTNRDISEAISNYILMFDQILKNYLTNNYRTYQDIAADYQRLRSYYHLEI